jgi:hypothetical protein
MSPEDQESKLRTWIEGYGQFGGNSNPDVSLSNSVGGQLQQSASSATPCDVAEDFKRYLTAKGVNSLSPQRFQLILRSTGWGRFFDPFMSSVSQSSAVFRATWDDAWEVVRSEDTAKWIVKNFCINPETKYDGWRLVLPNIYTEYVNSCNASKRENVEKSEFVKNWLTCGLQNLREEIQWIYFFSGPSERDRWIPISRDVNILSKWLATGLGANDSKKLSKLGFDSFVDLFNSRNLNLEAIEEWVNAGFANDVIVEFLNNNISLEIAKLWRDSNIVPLIGVLGWFRNGFKYPSEASNWIAIGFNAQAATLWKNFGFEPVVDVRLWSNLINRPEIVRIFIERGYQILETKRIHGTSLTAQHVMSGKTFDPMDFEKIKNLPFDALEETLDDWDKSKFTLAEIIKWRKLGFVLDEYSMWIDQDIQPQTAQRFKKYHFGPIQAGELSRNKISPSRAKEQGIAPTGL